MQHSRPAGAVPSAFSTLRSTPGFVGLTFSVLLLGFATSFAMPYMSLFAVRQVGMSPTLLGVFLTLSALSSIGVSTLIARISDRLPSRRPLLVGALVMAAAGYALLGTTSNFYLATLIAVVFLGAGSSSFPQVFALAKSRAGEAGEQGVTALRSVFSLAWVLGPGIGAVLLAHLGFGGLFLATAVCFALAMVPVLLDRAQESAGTSAPAVPVEARSTGTGATSVPLIALAFVLYGTAMHMGSSALPIHVTQNLGGTSGDVGLIVGLCALLEIPVMLAFVLMRRRPSNEKLILWGIVLFAVYYLIVTLAPGVVLIAAGQVVRAVVIAILATLGMAYIQELMPDRIGVATTLYANTMNAGALVSGLGIGVVAGAFGYGSVFVVCMALSVLSWAFLLIARRRGRRTRPE